MTTNPPSIDEGLIELRKRTREQPIIMAFKRAIATVDPAMAERLERAEMGIPDERMPKFLDALDAEHAAICSGLSTECDALREALWLFREFTIRNATQWQTGANHHHPIYPMIAELIGEMGGITAGEYYQFIQPENRLSLTKESNRG